MRFLIIGAGSMGTRRVRTLLSLGYSPLDITIYDNDTKKAEEVAKKYDIWWSDVIPNLILNKFDAVIISVPPLLKQKYISMCNDAKTPCFAEADVKEYSGNYAASATMRFHPAIQKIKELLDSGALGKVYSFTHHCGNHIEDWHPGADKKTYYAMSKDAGGCKEIFPFELSWLSYLFGTPVDAKGLIDKKLDDPDISADDVYATNVKFERYPTIQEFNIGILKISVTGTVLIDIVSRPAIRELHIVCERGFIEWNWNDDHISIRGAEDQDGMLFFNKGKAAEGYNANIPEQMYIAEMENFINSITPCCGDCKYIDPKEDHPRTTDHMCTKFNHRLMHSRYHPDFCKLNECKQYLYSREDEKACIEMLRKVEV
ncbi:MAG: Gfo/Idh/MocA family oxidoreductase [Candidatus Babeliales bacterium]